MAMAARTPYPCHILPSWGPRENAEKKLSILRGNTWGDQFFQTL